MSTDRRRRVVVVGGGVTGLTAAYRLSSADEKVDITLLEASPRLGGKIKTTLFGGVPVDEGPDAFLARVPEAIDLATELGIDNQFVSPAVSGAYVFSRGKLRRLPDGLVLGVPTSFFQLAGCGIVSWPGILRAGLDLVKRDNWPGQDESVGQMVSRRLGPEVAERLVDPLVGGINASDTSRLSARIATPQIADVARKNRSLIRGLRAMRAANPPQPNAPVFHSFEGGIQVLVDRLVAAIADVDVRLSTAVTTIERSTSDESSYTVHTSGASFEADAVVLASPASATHRLLKTLSPESARLLGQVEYASVALVTVAINAADIEHPLDGSGMLVPALEGKLMTACSWGHRKWPHWAGADDSRQERAVLRMSAGRHGDDRALQLDDDDLVEALIAEVGPILGINGPVLEWRVSRWPDSFPQYPPGHGEFVTRAEAALRSDAPGLVLAGASYLGVGIPACIRQGTAAAGAAIDFALAK
jgi:oxygen-dependent protoporphyrinogen oxidase